MLVAAGALFCYLTQALAGVLAWQGLGGGAQPAAIRASAALLLGPGLVTVQMVLYHALGIPFAVGWLALPWWSAAVVALVVRRGRRGQPQASRTPQVSRAVPGEPPGRLSAPERLVAGVAGLVVLVLAVRAFALPLHEGDEVNNFALFAKVFGTLGSLAPGRLTSLMEPGHVEYPHLVALNQAWLFALDQGSGPWTARGFEVLGAAAFVTACAGAFAPHAWPRASGCVVCIASPAVLMNAVGFADVRLLATFVLLGHQAAAVLRGGDALAPIRLALVLGTAALTKNEGLAVAAAGVVVLVVGTVRQRAVVRGAVALGIAAALLGTWPAVRASLGLTMHYVDRAFELPLDVLAAQAPRVGGALADLLFPTDWSGLLRSGVLAWVALPLAVWGARRDAAVRWLCLAWAAHLALYGFVLAIARPGDLDALLLTAAARLVLHTTAWPVLILARVLANARWAEARPSARRDDGRGRELSVAPAAPRAARPATP